MSKKGLRNVGSLPYGEHPNDVLDIETFYSIQNNKINCDTFTFSAFINELYDDFENAVQLGHVLTKVIKYSDRDDEYCELTFYTFEDWLVAVLEQLENNKKSVLDALLKLDITKNDFNALEEVMRKSVEFINQYMSLDEDSRNKVIMTIDRQDN